MENLCVISYNIRGYNSSKTAFLCSLIQQCDILCVQEHWLLKSQFARFLSDTNCQGYCLSSMNENEFNWGRPYGGVAILWKKDLKVTFNILSTIYNELAAVEFIVGETVFGLFNIYMPCDGCDTHKYIEMLSDVKSLCLGKGISHILVCGDLNTDLIRNCSKHTEALLAFAHEEVLSFCLHHDVAEIDYTYESAVNGSRSILDHILVSDNIFCDVADYYVSHSLDNLSDHSPVLLKIKIAVDYLKYFKGTKCASVKYNWKGANIEQINNYKACVDNFMSLYHNSQDSVSYQYNAIVKACVSATEICIPKVKLGRRRIYNWNAKVKRKRQTAMFWHRLWLDNDKPTNGIVFDIRRKTRRDYHEAVKLVLREQEILEAKSALDSLARNDNTGYWSKIKKVK